MRTIQTNIYTYDELSPKAQAKARDWFRQTDEFDPELDDINIIATILGIAFDTKYGRNNSGIFWSGFSAQGDGASFNGRYGYHEQSPAKIREWAPLDAELHRIADRLDAIQRDFDGKLSAFSRVVGNNYVHSNMMDVVTIDDRKGRYVSDAVASEVSGLMRAFADWIYKSLEGDYYGQQEDDYVADCIHANEYEFTEDGERYYK